jgi:hypothetical protein
MFLHEKAPCQRPSDEEEDEEEEKDHDDYAIDSITDIITIVRRSLPVVLVSRFLDLTPCACFVCLLACLRAFDDSWRK